MTNVSRHSAGPRIAVVAHSHPSISKGGAEISAYTLFQGLIELGCDAIFIAACPENLRKKAYRGSEREHFIFTRGEHFEPFFQLSADPVDAELERLLTAHRTQVVNFHHFTNLGLGALRRARAIPGLRMAFTLHEFLAICFNHGQMVTPVAQRLCEGASPEACATCFPNHSRHEFVQRQALFTKVLASFDQLISPSRFLAERFCAWGLDESRMFVIENGLARPPEAAPAPQPRRRREWVFGYFGQINPFKGVDVILDAAALLAKERIANVRIRIHGNVIGQSEAFCDRLREACSNGLVNYVGPYDYRTVDRLMGDCDYVVMPSRWWENSPVVIQEAFAAGRPVLCTGIGGMAEKVSHGVSGLHFGLGDAADLAQRMIEAAAEDTYRRLVKGLPRPYGGREMARRYLDAFAAACDAGSEAVAPARACG